MRVLMIEGRPAEHPIHRAYAKAIGADFIYIDKFLRYQGKSDNKLLVVTSWILTCFYLLSKRKYTVYFCGGPCPPLTLLKSAGLLGKRKKIVSLAANETLFFLQEKKYSRFTASLFRKWYNQTINGLICIGSFQEELAQKNIGNKKVKIRKIFNGLDDDFFENNRNFKYNVNAHDLLCVSNGPSGFRVYYKGIDLVIKVFEKCCLEGMSNGNLIIIGEWDGYTQKQLLKDVPLPIADRIIFTGYQNTYTPYLQSVGLSVHFSRGDSFPTSNLETLAMGIPTIVTDVTGTSEIVKNINADWVGPADVIELTERVKRFFDLAENEKLFLSNKAKDNLRSYKQTDSIQAFRGAFECIID